MGIVSHIRKRGSAGAAAAALLAGGTAVVVAGGPAGAQSAPAQASAISGTQFSFVANYNSDSVNEFTANANGNQGDGVANIQGSDTGLNGPTDVAAYGGDLFVTNSGDSSITVYPEGSSGDVEPTTTIEGSLTGLAGPYSMAFDSSGDLFVSNGYGTSSSPNGSVVEFTPSQYGQAGTLDTAPFATLGGPNTGLDAPWGIAFDPSGDLYVVNQLGSSVTEYSPDAMSGNASPVATLSGPGTGLDYPAGLALDASGNIYVANAFGNSITEYGSMAAVAPENTISGSNTGLNNPEGVAVDSAGNIYVANSLANYIGEVDVWNAGDSGNVAPDRSITGYEVGGPAGVTLAPVTTPAAPTDVSASAGNASATVSFVAPSSNGGAPVTSYTVTANDQTNPTNGGQTATGDQSPIVVSGLTNGDSYEFTVAASNAVGTGASSPPSNVVTPYAPPAFSVTPSQGRVGTPVTFAGQNFQPGETVTIYLGSVAGQVVATETADPSGSFSSRGAVPAVPYGTYQLVAVGSSSGDTAEAPLSVKAAVALSPESAPPGSAVHATLTGFLAHQSVKLRFRSPSGQQLAVVSTGSTGKAGTTFTVPSGTKAGPYAVYALGQGGGPYAETTLTVTSPSQS